MLHLRLLPLAFLVALLAACSRSGETGASGAKRGSVPSDEDALRSKTVIFDIDRGRVVDPHLWNPFVPGGRRDHGYHQAMIEPFFVLDYESGDLIPWLGESMISNETMDAWTLKIREGVRWSDGEVFNAADVVFTVNMLLEHAPELLESAALAEWVVEAQRVDNLTVRFVLSRPNPRFQMDYWSVKVSRSPPIVPEHIWKDKDPLTFKNYDPARNWPVMTGPYLLRSASETEFVYHRDDNWWGAASGWKPLPKPERLVWVWYGPEETRTAAMADHQLDSLMDITLGTFLALQQRNPNVIAWRDGLPYAWLDPGSRTLELNHAKPPWDDKEMRWALNYAIDRDQIVAIAYEGTTQASRHFFPAYAPLNRFVDLLDEVGLYDEYPVHKHDAQAARRIFESKGYRLNSRGYYEKGGSELTLDITTHEAYIEKQRIAQVVVEQLQRIGINATSRNQAGGTWEQNYQFGNFEARVGWHTYGSIIEPWASMDNFNADWVAPVGERAQTNGWRWENREYSALVDEIGTLPLGDPRIDQLFIEGDEDLAR